MGGGVLLQFMGSDSLLTHDAHTPGGEEAGWAAGRTGSLTWGGPALAVSWNHLESPVFKSTGAQGPLQTRRTRPHQGYQENT